jgi:hypothetical protein
MVVAHLLVLGGIAWAVSQEGTPRGGAIAGHVLLVAGIVEGALLLGWRLTQLPRSRALEFLLVSPMSPGRVFLAEAMVGLARLALVTLSGLPILAVLAAHGCLALDALPPLLVMPFTWGAVTGLGLTVWAYEPLAVRRWGERVAMVLVVLYLLVGVLGGEQLQNWAEAIRNGGAAWLQSLMLASLDCNPFGVLQEWLRHGPEGVWPLALTLQLGAMLGLGFLLFRGATRLPGHFHERHYHPLLTPATGRRRQLGNRPLAWWAVRRVTQYAGRINLWLASGFGLLYALYIVAGPSWPSWLGRSVFQLCDQGGGVATLSTVLVVLAAVPAAFQYGLWDSNAQDRCRRLELLLLTELEARDYWDAAAAAAWQRGRGYFATAVVLWAAALAGGQANGTQVLAALTAGVLLWCLYFALGFRAFSRGVQASGLGMLLTLGLPLAVYCCECWEYPLLGRLLPPGSVLGATARAPDPWWALGPVLTAILTLAIVRQALARCQAELRLWYERHQGRRISGSSPA